MNKQNVKQLRYKSRLRHEFFKHRKNIKIPDIEILLIQRKMGRIFFLEKKLRAKLDAHPLITKYIE